MSSAPHDTSRSAVLGQCRLCEAVRTGSVQDLEAAFLDFDGYDHDILQVCDRPGMAATDSEPETPMSQAIRRGDKQIVEALIRLAGSPSNFSAAVLEAQNLDFVTWFYTFLTKSDPRMCSARLGGVVAIAHRRNNPEVRDFLIREHMTFLSVLEKTGDAWCTALDARWAFNEDTFRPIVETMDLTLVRLCFQALTPTRKCQEHNNDIAVLVNCNVAMQILEGYLWSRSNYGSPIFKADASKRLAFFRGLLTMVDSSLLAHLRALASDQP